MSATSGNQNLPRGYKTVDRTKLRGRLENPSPLDKGLRSLVVRDKDIRDDADAERKQKPKIAQVKSISDIISSNIQASKDLRTVTHFIKRAEQIWTTLLLKPNGDQKQILMYDSDGSETKNSKLHELLIQKVENYFTTKYPFEEAIPQIIKDVLFRTGSYVHINMSHAVLDHLINGMEVDGNERFNDITKSILDNHFVEGNPAIAKNLGYIRKNPSTGVSGFESLYGKTPDREPEYHLIDERLKWTFTDNPLVLKMGSLSQRMREDRLSTMSGMEHFDSAISNVFRKEKGRRKVNKNNLEIVNKVDLNKELASVYKKRDYDYTEHLSIRKGKYYSGNGRGLGISFHWPSESFIPVHINGEIGKPFGGLALTDPKTGEPLRNVGDQKYYQGTTSNDTAAGAMGSMNDIISHIRQIADGKECNYDMKWMAEFASATLEKELIEGFINGDLNKNVSITLTEENKKLFLSRALRDQGVRVIFIPSEYMTYVAMDFTTLGVGKSLVDEAKLHIGRLAVLQTADALAQIENAISHTLLEISPEAEDTDVRNTIALARDEWFSGNPTLHDILGYNNVSIDAILDRFKEQSVTVKVTAGDNPHVVAPEINASQMEREPLKSVDPESIESLMNTIAGFFGLKRSWLEDTGEGNDFAIEALADQELLRNQTTEYSKTFSKFFSDIMRKHIRVNEPLIVELVEVIKENKGLYQKPDQTGELEVKEEEEVVIKEGEEEPKKKGKGKKKGEEEPEIEEDKPAKGKKKGKDKEEEPVETEVTEEEETEEFTDEDMDEIGHVLKDFIDTFFVTLPTPAITDSLIKLEDKLEAVEKLVEFWVSLGGGVKMLKRRADEAGLNGDDIVENIKANLLNEAFERFNLPMPFESILNKGKTGGMMQYIERAVDLDSNVIQFLSEWQKRIEKNDKKSAKLKAKVDEANQEEQPEDQFNADGDIPPEDDVPSDGDANADEDNPPEDESDSTIIKDDDAANANAEMDDATKPEGGDDLWDAE